MLQTCRYRRTVQISRSGGDVSCSVDLFCGEVITITLPTNSDLISIDNAKGNAGSCICTPGSFRIPGSNYAHCLRGSSWSENWQNACHALPIVGTIEIYDWCLIIRSKFYDQWPIIAKYLFVTVSFNVHHSDLVKNENFEIALDAHLSQLHDWHWRLSTSFEVRW